VDKTVELGSDERAFVLMALEGKLSGPTVGGNSLVTFDEADDFDDTLVLIHTGSQWGPFRVTTRSVDAFEAAGGDWEDVVEFSLRCQAKVVVAELVEGEPLATVIDGPGEYRVRVSVRGRSESRDRDRSSDDIEDDAPAIEHYVIESWPAPMSASELVRHGSDLPLDPNEEEPETILPEQEAGVAGTRAIGRDLDGGPSARPLSGELGQVVASMTIPGTRRRLFGSFAHGYAWTGGYGMSGSVDLVVGGSYRINSYLPVVEGGDGMTGEQGEIVQTWLAIDSPKSVTKAWNWHLPVYGEWDGPSPGRAYGKRVVGQRPFLAQDTTLRIDLSESGSAGARETLVQIQHDGLPIEWLEDMSAYWAWMLAVAESRGFGLR
jgi:hypothetical protein